MHHASCKRRGIEASVLSGAPNMPPKSTRDIPEWLKNAVYDPWEKSLIEVRPKAIITRTKTAINVQWWKKPMLQVPSTARSDDDVSRRIKDICLEAGYLPLRYLEEMNMHNTSASASISDSGNSKMCRSIILSNFTITFSLRFRMQISYATSHLRLATL